MPQAKKTNSTDPIFAAMERHKAAYRAWVDGLARVESLNHQTPLPRVQIAYKLGKLGDGERTAIYAYSEDEVQRHFDHVAEAIGGMWGPAYSEKMAAGCRKLRADLASQISAFEKTPRGQAIAARDQAGTEELAAREFLASTCPTTFAGAVALTRYVATNADQDAFMADELMSMFENLNACLAKIDPPPAASARMAA